MSIIDLAKQTKALAEKATPDEIAKRASSYTHLQSVVHGKKPETYGDYYCGFEDGFKSAASRTSAPELADAVIEMAEVLEKVIRNMKSMENNDFWLAAHERVLSTGNKAHLKYGLNIRVNLDKLRDLLTQLGITTEEK